MTKKCQPLVTSKSFSLNYRKKNYPGRGSNQDGVLVFHSTNWQQFYRVCKVEFFNIFTNVDKSKTYALSIYKNRVRKSIPISYKRYPGYRVYYVKKEIASMYDSVENLFAKLFNKYKCRSLYVRLEEVEEKKVNEITCKATSSI